MYYHFKIHKEAKGFWAECIELQGCHTEAKNMNSLLRNMNEVLNLYLSESVESNVIFELPSSKIICSSDIVKVKVDPSVAFAFLIKRYRIKKKLTLREMADRLNIKSINTYSKLEKAKSSNPELRTLAKIKDTFLDFPFGVLFKT